MSSLAIVPTDNADAKTLPPAASPLVRRGLRRLLVIVMIVFAGLTYFWDEVSVWQTQSQAERLLQANLDTEALSLLRSALLKDGVNPVIVLQLARTHRRLGNLEKASVLVASAEKLGARSEKLKMERRLIEVQSGHIRDFDKEFPQLIVDAGDYGADILQAYVQGLFANLRTDDALQLLKGWEDSSPTDAQPKFLAAYLLQGINRLPLAIEAYRQGLVLAPARTTMRRRLAQALLETGDIDAAKSELAVCQKETPRDAEVYLLLAQCAFEKNDLAHSLVELGRTLEIAPQHVDARRLRGQISLANSDYQAALQDLQFVAAKQPDDTVAREALGRALQYLGRSDEAKFHFDFVSFQSKEQAETGRLIRQVLSEPENAPLRFEIGERLFKLGAFDDGVKWLRAAIELEPEHRQAHLLLAEYFERQGDIEQAKPHRDRLSAARDVP